MTNDPAITIADLHKSYGSQAVLRGIDIEVPAGTVFGLLGPNGAGKTTVVKILSTLIRADAGRLRVAGHDVATDPDAVRAAIGVTGQFSAVDGLLTGTENLRLMADLHHLPRSQGRDRARALQEQFELTDAAPRPVSSYSGGMRRRLDLAMTLVGDPQVIFLDEPTTGLDPRSRREMWGVVQSLVGRGVTVFLTTQYLDEADHLADSIAVLDHGHLVAHGSPAQLKAQVPGGHVEVRFADHVALAAAGAALPTAVRDEEALTLQLPADGVPALRTLLDRLDTAGATPEALTTHTPDLDDVFLALTGRPTPSTSDTDSDDQSSRKVTTS